MTDTGSQVRAARALLGWGVRDLAGKSGVHTSTIVRVEAGGDAYASTIEKLRGALEAAGVIFLADGEASAAGGAGVRFDTTRK